MHPLPPAMILLPRLFAPLFATRMQGLCVLVISRTALPPNPLHHLAWKGIGG